jgi:N utilization substance protein B
MTQKRTHGSSRRDARERAMQVLYAYEISREPVEMLMESIAAEDLGGDSELFRFAQQLVYTTLNHRTDIDAQLVAHCANWKIERVALLDHIVLALGVAEFLFFPDIPCKVTINEYVDIARTYSTEQSDRFVNGVLDGALKALTAEGRIRKMGRGLVTS